jgi:hypothetical protein
MLVGDFLQRLQRRAAVGKKTIEIALQENPARWRTPPVDGRQPGVMNIAVGFAADAY